jgi:PadR family transcriptional regulator PadR
MDLPITPKAALLQALVRGESYGLELIERVAQQTHGQIRLNQGSVYPALQDMEEEGLVESREGDPLPERGGRPRRYFHLTAEGKRTAATQRKAVMGLFGDPLLQGAR